MPLKRDPSLIPLSHDHHHALVRVFEIRRAVRAGASLAEQVEATRDLWRRSLAPHFEAEEAAVFPLLAEIDATATLVAQLLEEHGRMRHMIAALEPAAESLGPFANLLESHVRAEERQLFPLYQDHVPAPVRKEVETRVRAILERPDDTAKICDLS